MVVIRPMQQSDCKAVSELEKEVFSQPWSEQGFLDALAIKESIFLLAEEEGNIIGYLGMYVALDEGECFQSDCAIGNLCFGYGICR